MEAFGRSIFMLMLGASLMGAHAQEMSYTLAFEPETHIVNVTLDMKGVTEPELLLKMPVWAPGYYIILDSPKHLHGFSAQDADGNELGWKKENKTGWRIATAGAKDFTVSYRIFANQKSVGEAMVDATHAYLPGNEVYMYVDGKKELPITVKVKAPERWTAVCTGLPQKADGSYYAIDYDRLVDSPIYAGTPSVHEFKVGDKDYTLCVADKKDISLECATDNPTPLQSSIHAAIFGE